MKNRIYILTLLLVSSISAQDISFSFENAQITNDGLNDFYEVDVMVSSSADLLLGTGQFYINYNTAAFGTFVESSGVGVFENTGTILGTSFWNLVFTDNTESRVSYAYVQLAPSGAYGADQTITTTPKVLTHLKLQYLPGQTGVDPSICFESETGFTSLNFTACGGSFGADCFNFPGTQITNDSFDCSGADVAILVVSQIAEDRVSLYPNPAQTNFEIQGLKTSHAIRIYDINGRMILEQERTDNRPIDMGPYKDGIYLVRIENEDRSVTKRLIKKSN